MKKRFMCLVLACSLLASGFITAYSEEAAAEPGVSTSENLFDDCADFSKTVSHSDGILPDVITAENQFAFAGDYTVFMRSTTEEEWVTYEIPVGGYLVFYTFFRQNAEVAHFRFDWSEDGSVWRNAEPVIQTEVVDSSHWIPVSYKLNNLPQEAKYLRTTFQKSADEVAWSPCIASVDCNYPPDPDGGFADCKDTPYAQATTVLKNLGLVSGYSEHTYQPYGAITRAEFCQMAASVLALGQTYTANQPQAFPDVPSSHWAAGAVYALYGLGVIHGDENGYFLPEDPVTLPEAAKIISASLGYTILAEEQGGYPSGYLLQANRLGLLTGVQTEQAEGALNRGDAALLFYNALDVDLLYQTQFGDDARYTYDGTTILSRYHGIEKIEGVVSEVGVASIRSSTESQPGRCRIGEESYQYAEFDPIGLLGQTVTAYVQYDRTAGDTKLLYAYGKDAPVCVAYPDFLQLTESTVDYIDDTGIERRRRVTANTRVVYNNRYFTRVGVMEEALPFASGFLYLIDNDENGTIDVILVKDYETYFTAAAGKLQNPISDRHRGSVNLHLDEADAVTVFQYGEELPYDGEMLIAADTVVQAARSKDGKWIEVQILGTRATGVMAHANTQEGWYTIGETAYLASAYFKQYEQPLETSAEEIIAYLDINGCIAAVAETVQTLAYGYLQSVSPYDVFGQNVEIRVITESGKAEAYTVNSKTRVNGTAGRVAAVASLPAQLVRFRADEDREITRLETATDCFGTYDTDCFTRNYTSAGSKYIGENIRAFGSIYQLDNRTKVFFIPEDPADIEAYEVLGAAALYTDFQYHVDVYDLSEAFVAGAVVIYQADSDKRRVSSYDGVAVVRESATTLNADGEKCLKVFAYSGGAEIELLFDADGAQDMTDNWIPEAQPRNTANGNLAFQPGELFQYYVDSSGFCHSFRMILSQSQIEELAFYEKNLGDYGALSEDRYYSELYTGFGSVTALFSGKFLLCADTTQAWRRTISIGSSSIYVYTRSNRTLRLGDASDLAVGDPVFVRLYYTDTREILIIK